MNENMNKVNMNDQELVTDLLDSEKYLTTMYQTATIEAATPNIRTGFKEVLNSTLDIQHDVFSCMSQNGWYPVDSADPNKVTMTKNKFSADMSNNQ